MRLRNGLLLLAAALTAATGCATGYRATAESDAVIRDIEAGRYRPRISPACMISTRKKLYGIGEDIRVTVRVVAPAEGKVLDPYLPVRGRFRVVCEDTGRELKPPASSARLAWAEIPVDGRRQRDRSFTQAVNRVFAMARSGWYVISWEGEDDLGNRVRSGKIHVRVLARARK